MFSKNNPVVLFLDRTGFSVFQGTLVNIVKLPFSQEIVSNLEVINRDQLFALISSFIDKNRINSSILIVLLADSVVYEKDLSKILPKPQSLPANNANPLSNQKAIDFMNREQQIKTEIQNFLQNIPFEDILAKVIKTESLMKLVAVNKDLIFSTTDPFVKKGFLIESIVPCFLYGSTVTFTNGLTSDIARLVLRKPELLKIGNLLTDQEKVNAPQNAYENEKEEEKEKTDQSKRKYMLIAIFVVLLVILGILVIGNLTQNKSLNNNVKNIPKNTLISSSPTPISAKPDLPIGSASANLNMADVKIIIQNSQSESISGSLKEALAKIGFKNIITEDFQGAVPEKSSVIFSDDIPAEIRQNTILEINKLLPNILILEGGIPGSKITIIVGRL